MEVQSIIDQTTQNFFILAAIIGLALGCFGLVLGGILAIFAGIRAGQIGAMLRKDGLAD